VKPLLARTEQVLVVFAVVACELIGLSAPVWAQTPTGHVSVTADHLPNADDATELRVRAFVEQKLAPSKRVSIVLSGWIAGLAAERAGEGREDLVAQPHDLYVDIAAGPVDIRAGLARVVWGRLDEVQPSDVVNPLDVSAYLFEGRGEARVPLPLTRVRWSASEASRLEVVWAPVFRRSRFDWLDEASSPFNLARAVAAACGTVACPAVVFARDEPARTLRAPQGGMRYESTAGRVDWAVSAWRGIETFGVYELAAPTAESTPALAITERYPRFTMVGADIESVLGEWAWRGEAAAFVDATLPAPGGLGGVEGRRIVAGGGVDRRAGSASHLSATVLVEHQVAGGVSDTSVSVVGGLQQAFARETRQLRVFAAWNAADRSAFLRTSGAWSVRDNLAIEAALGWFAGDGTHFFSRFADRDFVSIRLKAYF
jgi:hypothetical protein